ncbi:PEP-CTERM protein-sorting domain-containing protein [Prosthecobacter debontii]|uniref:PEP-CTERM protein-sorting domain-containing protein n=1 Tax=Prosthecobacter debontii TaxID=48467 RepID=A0A1T4XCY7_9BACT|nr:LamG-like jellyroll fold domain-containing protein [Prosthecobacter debontii]SKA86831.1 PEP-CTERM protein-sorting domain-containing protein [Prosthecobacter debontii]
MHCRFVPTLLATLLLLASSSPAASVLVYYDGSASGTTLLDQSGNGYNSAFDANGTTGTGSTILTTTPAYSGSGAYVSLTANGTNQSGRYGVTTSGLSYDFNNSSWSVAMFYNRQSTATNDTLFHIGVGDGFGGENELYAWATASSTTLSLQHYPDADVNLGASNKMNLNAWHHLAVTFTASGLNDGTGVLNYYVDGTLIGTDSTFTLATNNSFFFGGQGSGTSDRNFIGFMDEMALYQGVLDASQITDLASGVKTPLSVIPEPSRMAFLMLGLLGWGMRRRR